MHIAFLLVRLRMKINNGKCECDTQAVASISLEVLQVSEVSSDDDSVILLLKSRNSK